MVTLIGVLLIAVSPSSFVWEKVDKNEEFTINYAHHFINGEVIHVLSQPSDTLFTDMWDYFIHWQAKLDSAYPFAIYSFTTAGDERFRRLRDEMFVKNPPTFYYTYCPRDTLSSPYIASETAVKYVQLQRNGKPACTYILKTKIVEISDGQWEKAASLGFSRP